MRSRRALPDPRLVTPLLLVVAVLLTVSVGCSGAAKGPDAEDQLEFGVEMAREGLWQEALFRFERANRIRPGNPRILNNMAVALEANGRFDEALEAYREALRVSPGNQDLKQNYARFVDFYESYRAESGTGLLEQVAEDETEGGPGR